MAYWIDGTNGSSANPGTLAQPFLKLVDAAPGGALPATTIYMARGTTIVSGYNSRYTLPNSGTCTIRSYDNGSGSTARPSIASTSTSGFIGGGNADSVLDIDGIAMSAPITKDGFVCDSGQDLKLNNCYLSGFKTTARISGGGTRITQCTIIGFARSGIYAEPTAAAYIESGGYIGYNTITDTVGAVGDGIALHGNGRAIPYPTFTAATGWIIEYNTVTMNGAENCIDCQEQYAGVIVRYNTGTNAGQWAYMEGQYSIGNVVYGNKFVNCGAGMLFRGATLAFGNVVLGWDGTFNGGNGADCVGVNDDRTGAIIVNNFFAADPSLVQTGTNRVALFRFSGTYTGGGLVLRNNVFYKPARPSGNGNGPYFIRAAGTGVYDFEAMVDMISHNRYVDERDTSRFLWNGAAERTFAQWKALDTTGADDNFDNVGSSVETSLSALGLDAEGVPSPTSSVIGAGVYVADAPTDLTGEPFANPPSIGAYEAGSGGVVGGRSVAGHGWMFV